LGFSSSAIRRSSSRTRFCSSGSFAKIALDYERTTFESFGAAPDRDPEGLVVGRFQLSY